MLDMVMGQLTDGTIYASDTKLNAQAKDLTVNRAKQWLPQSELKGRPSPQLESSSITRLKTVQNL